MRIALYIEDGLEHIVLTPESKVETDILAKLHDAQREINIERGSFYECRGGFVRQSANDTSTMLVLRPVAARQVEFGQ